MHAFRLKKPGFDYAQLPRSTRSFFTKFAHYSKYFSKKPGFWAHERPGVTFFNALARSPIQPITSIEKLLYTSVTTTFAAT
ncbi:hypothetical protein C7B69_12410 [filamentous cyanobacterium Phorm 46]|nr:hypothetical protein C7B69_12410 [filamentous cyanobacterium Phorm 46]PSB51927.1 hypothetical protein C7B67_09120 [filamentous cyanobacterium Phorm 6]